MLHRSFKPAKCKTSLKLAVSRIKLLKNKREAHVKQLRRELAQLLESGQEQTARIRVEHVVREEKTMAAYELIEIYCELIAARMPMIESQKNCPIDLKEAISSVIFASPRCADIPELVDVKKHITAKYGKEFVSSAVELRPDCGVNRMLVEKLSAKAPDGPKKIKILSEIAEEHNVKWEKKSFNENDIEPQDFQTVPSHHEKSSYVEPPQVHATPVRDEKGPPNLHGSSQHKERHDVSAELHKHNASFGAKKVDGNKSTTSGRPNPEIRPPGSGRSEIRYLYPENRSPFPGGRNNWNMEFKDAASAAQAAAESAERASMAARAAAELSNREKMIRQYSTGSHNSTSRDLREEGSQEYAEKHPSTDSVNRIFSSSDSLVHNEQINARDQGKRMPDQYYRSSHENVVKHTQSASLTSNSSFGEHNPFGNGSQMAETHPNSNSYQEKSDFFHKVSLKKPESQPEEDFVSELHDDMNTEDIDHFGGATMNRQYINVSSSSQYTTQFDSHYDVLELNRRMVGNNAVADLYVTDEGNIHRSFKEASSYDDTAVQFDDSGSEDDDYKFHLDQNYEGQGSSLYFPSPGSKPEIDLLANRYASSPGKDIEEKRAIPSSQAHFSVFSESSTKSADSPGREDLLPVTFDDSDCPSSESEEDLVESKVDGPNLRETHVASGSINDGNVDIDRKLLLSPSVGSDSMQEHFEKKMRITSMSENSFGYDESLTRHSSSKGISSASDLDVKENVHLSQSPDIFNSTETLEESHIESGKELNYGTLTGGLRNKTYRRPPHIKNLSDKGSLPSGGISVQNEKSSPSVRTSMSFDARAQETHTREVSRGNRSLGLRAGDTASDYDTYNMVVNKQETVATRDPPIQKVVREVNRKSSSRASVPYFDSESTLPKQSSARPARPVVGFSQRTTAPSKAGISSSSTATHLPKASVTSGTGLGWKSSSRVSHDRENQKVSSSWTKSSDNSASSEHEPAKLAATKSFPETTSNISSSVETMTSSARIQQPSSSLPKTLSLDSDSGGGTPSKQKASHVHPKLPDYDSFAAHFLSLKKGRQ
ncbi:hypothetical protein L6164_005169 [Bauhinia variegata]|uniref:Uncharacterized protein n=1 Tax=Bauhinia variegata TaxID=167791 RepID=A0ACB9PQG1_BAUVA|nr:hypothetical protein L6164_005169 [Bauhinia variegata]